MKKEESLEKAVRILQKGGVVAIPTETVYGLGASIEESEGVRKIFSLKARPSFNPLIVHIYEYNQVFNLSAEWPKLAEVLARRFWPGPLSIIVKKALQVDFNITGGLPTVAIRMPSHPVARALLKKLASPIAAPSANCSGKTSPTSMEHVKKDFPQVFTLEGGNSEFGLESTVIRIEEDCQKTFLLRPGVISKEAIETCLKQEGISTLLLEEKNSHLSPGSSLKHYEPEKPLVCFDFRKITVFSEEKISILLSKLFPKVERMLHLSSKNSREMKLYEDPYLVASHIYRDMRNFVNHKGVDFFFVIRKPYMVEGLWEAIWDRLERASSIALSP